MSLFNKMVALKSAALLRALPIGGIVTLSVAPMYSDKVVVLKQTNSALCAIGYNAACDILVVSQVAPRVQLSGVWLCIVAPRIISNVAAAVLLDYVSYSQLEWRYIRYMFSKLAYMSTIVQHCFFDAALRPVNSGIRLNSLKPTFILVLQHMVRNLSVHTFMCGIIEIAQFLNRSRTANNVYADTTFVDAAPQETHYMIENSVPQDDDDDVEYEVAYKAIDVGYASLEEQVCMVGLLLSNHMYTFTEFNSLFSFSYALYHAALIRFFTCVLVHVYGDWARLFTRVRYYSYVSLCTSAKPLVIATSVHTLLSYY